LLPSSVLLKIEPNTQVSKKLLAISPKPNNILVFNKDYMLKIQEQSPQTHLSPVKKDQY